jgi:hypothetical protein
MYPDTQQPQIERLVGAWGLPAATRSVVVHTSVPFGMDYRPGPAKQTYTGQADDDAALADETELSPETRALRVIIEQAVALGFDIEPELLSYPTRGRARTALARQVGMYVTHVGLSFSLTQVGQLFDRDRTTVAHACRMVELRRDDATFDRAIELLERVVRIMCAPARRPDTAQQPVSPPSLIGEAVR